MNARPGPPAAAAPRALALALLCAAAAAPLPAQGRERDRLHVKLRDEVDVAAAGGSLHSRSGLDLAAVQTLFDRAVAVEPLVPGVSRELLDRWHARACEVLPPGRRPGHLGHWFVLQCTSAAAADDLLDRLRREPLVAHCHREPAFGLASAPARGSGAAPQSPDPPPATPQFTSMQGTLAGPPAGLGLRWAHGILGARGRGVRLCMVENDWFVDHEDIGRLHAGSFLGVAPPGTPGPSNHGTTGASLLVADRNTWGLCGGADETDLRCISFPLNGGLPNSIVVAAASVQPGDVVMLSVMFLLGWLGPDDWVPVEVIQGVYDAVLTVTANGRIVVATAANGGRSLDDPRFLGMFDRAVRDSGCIFVGATDGASPVRAPWCNSGSIVDANSWGENVVAAGHGDLFFGNNDRRQAYTSRASGTSAAMPLVCSTVASLQGAARRQLGRDLTHLEVRGLLRAHGAPVAGIGTRPDLRALFAAAGILDGLELSAPDVLPGESATALVSGAAGGALLFASLGTGQSEVGLNRAIHLDLASIATVGWRPLAGGQAAFPLAIPNDAVLHGVQLYLQALVVPAGAGLHVTNSGHLSVL